MGMRSNKRLNISLNSVVNSMGLFWLLLSCLLLIFFTGQGQARAQSQNTGINISGAYSTDNNTMLLMHFDEGTGEPQDSSGRGHHGTRSGATWTTDGEFGNAMNFDGDDMITIADTDDLDVGSALTIEAWVYPTVTSGLRGVFERAPNQGYLFSIENTKLRFVIGAHWVTDDDRSSSANIAANTWSHVAVTFDSGQLKFYINGELDSTYTTVSTILPDAKGVATIGRRGTHLFKGIIDELRISNKARVPGKEDYSLSEKISKDSPPAVLVVTFAADDIVRPWQKELIDAGFQVKAVKYYNEVNWSLLRQFNLVVLTPPIAYDPTDKDASPWVLTQKKLKTWKELMKQYLDIGGGVFVYGAFSEITLYPVTEAILKPYGANMLFEKIVDPSQSYLQPSKVQWKYCWTTEVIKTSLTKNVETIFYPIQEFMTGPTTSPLKVTDDWQVLVKGAATAYSLAPSFPTQPNIAIFEEKSLGTYKSGPPLIAVREVGKGRLAISGISPLTSFIWSRHPVFEDVSISRGDGVKPSDLGKLLCNIYKWLAEPSLTARTMGGYRMTGELKQVSVPQPIDWAGVKLGMQPRSFSGVIGCRTALTGGEGNVADWVTVAKKAGLNWVVFTEDFTKLTPQSWEKFCQECNAASSDDFVAVPGWEIWDYGDNQWVEFGLSLRWPPAVVLSEDGKRIKNTQGAFFSHSSRHAGGPINIKQNVHPAWSYRNYNVFAIVAQKKGETLGEFLEEYLYQQGLDDDVQPIAVNIMNSPKDLLSGLYYRTYVHTPDIGKLHQWLTAPEWGAPDAFISTGPMITSWYGYNRGRSADGEWYLLGTERWQIHLQVKSSADLAEVTIYDKTNIYARYLPEGKEFDLILDGLHDQERAFVAVVTDVKGGRAITSVLMTEDCLNRRFMCSDRNNAINHAVQRDPVSGRLIFWRPGSQQEKGSPPMIGPHLPEESWLLNPPACDGGVYIASFLAEPMVYSEERPPVIIKGEEVSIPRGNWNRLGRDYSRISCPLASKHILIQRWTIEHEYLQPQINRYQQPYVPFRPLDDCNYEVSELALVMQPREFPLTVIEGKVTFKKDVTVDQHPFNNMGINLGRLYAYPKPGEYDNYVLHLQDVKTLEDVMSDKLFTWFGELPAGSYFLIYPSMIGTGQALMAIDDGYKIHATAKIGWARGYISVGEPGQKYTAGTELRYRCLYIATGASGMENKEQIEWVKESMGITGSPAYSVKPTQGKVLGTKLFLDLEAEDGGFTGIISKANLPVRLPIRIYGLNPNWSAAVYDRKRKELLPFGFADGIGYASIDIRQGQSDVYIGNLAVCDEPELRLWVVEKDSNKVKVTVHNPTDKEIKTIVRNGQGYNRVPGFKRKVTVPAGTSINVIVEDERRE